MFVNFNILNQLGSPAINSNTFANRPAAGQTGRLFVSTDTYEIYRDNGTTWDLIGGPGSSTITGSGTATQVAYFTSSQAIGSSANLFWDNTNGFLGVGTATPTTRIEAVKTDGIGIYANFTTNAGSGSSTTALWAKNVTNSSGFAAVIEETTPNTTAGQYPLLIKHSLSSGTAGVGMGTGLHFQLPDDAGTFKTTQLTIETINAAAATYATRYRFNVQSNGSSTPVAYINATGIGIFTATPGAALDVHSTGTIAQFNTTSATGNTYIAFQRTGSGLWRIGDTYNGGPNQFEIHNTVLGIDAVNIKAATNKTSWQATENYTSGVARGNYFDYNLTLNPANPLASPNAISAVGASLDLTLQGSITIPSGARSGLDAYNSISFTTTGTLTHNQGTQIRAYSNLTAGWAFNGSATGTITHLAGLRALFPDNSGSAVTITNNYALLLNDQTANTGTVTYTNRWGVYQEGASDLNYMAANLLLGSTVNSGDKLQVTGTSYFNGTNSTNGTLRSITGDIRSINIGSDTPTLGSFLTVVNTSDLKQYLLQLNASYGLDFWNFNGSSFSKRATLTAEGNLGIRVTPSSSWSGDSSNTAIQLNGGSIWGYGTSQFNLLQNAIYDGSNLLYVNTAAATAYRQISGVHSWYNAPSGTAGNAITFTQAMTLDASGNLFLNTTSGTGRLVIAQSNATQPAIALTVDESTIQGPTSNTSIRMGGNLSLFGSNILNFSTNASERARFTSGGNFLIGTTTDAGQKLQVNGTALFSNTVNISASVSATSNVTLLNLSNGSDGGVKINFSNSVTSELASIIAAVSGTGAGTDDGKLIFRTSLNATASDQLTISSSGAATFSNTITTAAPTTGTAAPWKLGSRVAATVVVNTTEYIEVDIGGTLYKLATVT